MEPDAQIPTDLKTPSRHRTVVASGMLCGILGVVVLYTNRGAFHSPLAVVVVAAVGLTAVLLQLRLHNRVSPHVVHSPIWLNVAGVFFAVLALFADFIHLSPHVAELMALGAVGSFGISGAVILHAFRKHRIHPQ